MSDLLSVIIPSRNEPYLRQTVDDLLKNATQEIEIIVILDGYYPEDLSPDPKVRYLYRIESKGMRNGINSGVALARGKYIMKIDAHCSFAKGYDEELKKNCKDNWVVVPRRYPLDVEKWDKEVRTDNKYPIDYEYIDPNDLHGVEWRDRRDDRKDIMIDETMTAQGSCWFTTKKHFDNFGGLDEKSYGSFFLEFQEISFKTWLSGGKVMVNKNTSYCHFHKNKGRGYSLRPGERDVAVEFTKKWRSNSAWSKQTVPFQTMIDNFMPIPGWE